MIIYPNGSFATQQGLANGNFADEEWQDKVLLVDDNSEIGQEILSGRGFEVILDGEKVIDINLLPILEVYQIPTQEERLEAIEIFLLELL